MKIGIYVGSFNPPHLGHLKVINYLLENNYVDKVIVIPTGNYWDKQDLIDIKHRINMLKFYENDKVIINDELNNIPYTYQVLDLLSKKYPNDNLQLIIGDDNLPKFHLWKNYQEILKYQVIVLKRNDINTFDTIAYQNNRKQFILIKNFPKVNISSTIIRDYLNEKNSNVIKYLNPNVLNYIIDNNLYNIRDTKRFIKKKI